MSFSIRAFTPDDYRAVAHTQTTCWPDYPISEAELRRGDDMNEPHCKLLRLVGEDAGDVVAAASYNQSMWSYHPQKFWLSWNALSPHATATNDAALYEALLDALRPHEVTALRMRLMETQHERIAFAQAQGFHEERRDWESRLDVASFDVTPYADVGERVHAAGIDIQPLTALTDDPDHRHKLWELDMELCQDVPSGDPPTGVTFEHYCKLVFDHPNLLPDAYFVALKDGAYIGMHNLWRRENAPDWTNGLTGVRRAHRRHGVALALKLRGIAVAQAHGIPSIKTWNASNNRPMLSINEQLGFRKQPAWIDYVKWFRAESLEQGA